MKRYIYLLSTSFLSVGVYSQTVNEGLLSVLPDTEVSTLASFSNEAEGGVYNDGTIYFYRDFHNEGVYTFDGKRKSSYAIFSPYEGREGSQHFTGGAPAEFYDVLFDNPMPIRAFELGMDMSISGTANFHSGIVQVDSLLGALVFQPGARAINVKDGSHADGEVEKVGNEAFVYPIGDEGYYRLAGISAPKTLKDAFLSKYYLKNSDAFYPHRSKSGVIEAIDDKEYWTLYKEGQSDVLLTLSWDVRTTPSWLHDSEDDALHIVRWDEQQQLWVDEGGIVDRANQTVTTPTQVSGYGIFTLGKVATHLISDGDVVVYNAVSPNGDGHNDHFIIDNIERYPHNTVEIYNRWGVKVYETKGYTNSSNHFKGYSEGRVTVDKGSQLPTGTYYYILRYEYTDAKGSRMITKTGYLHLESEH